MTVLLVDANNLAMRAIHGMARSGLTNDEGVQTGPAYGFINGLSKVIREENPTHVVCCWDGGRSDYRLALDDQYKAHRTQAAPEVEQAKHSAFSMMKRFLTLAGIFHIERPGVEADDLIARYWHSVRPLDEKLTIVSNDKDFLQLLIDQQVEQVRLGSSNTPTDRWTAARVREEFGCDPATYRYALALAGDASDGVPGVPRFGIKTAAKALAKVNNQWFDVLFDPRIKPHENRAKLNLALVDLRSGGPPGLVLPDLPPFNPTTPQSIAWGPLVEWLSTYQMKSVQSRLYDGTLWRV